LESVSVVPIDTASSAVDVSTTKLNEHSSLGSFPIGTILLMVPPLINEQNTRREHPPVFNTNLWSFINGYVTFADLLGYAQLSISNVWSASQLFADGLFFQGSINNISVETFSYLSNAFRLSSNPSLPSS
jgi:hypothetical protein